MEIRYNVTGDRRKELVRVISETTGARAVYKYMPTCNYEIDYFTVTKDGTLLFSNRSDTEEVEKVLDAIAEAGFECEPAAEAEQEAHTGSDSAEDEETEEAAHEADTEPDSADTEGLTMLHDPSTIAMGNTRDMEQAIKTLNEVKESIINAYVAKSGLSRGRVSKLMSEETWLNAKKAVELGFADEVLYDGKKPEEAEEPAEDDAEPIEAQLYSVRVMDMAILDRLGAGEKPPAAPVIGMDGKTDDGAVPYQILMNQLDFLR